MENYKILIVDDSIEILKLIVSIIENNHPHYTLYQSNNAENAITIAKLKSPDLIITDWDMPHMNGLEMISHLKKSKETKDIPCIVVTGIFMSAEHLKTAIEIGAIDFIKKPIDSIELLARMNSVINIVEKQKLILKEKDLRIAENIALNSEITHFLRGLKTKLTKIGGTDNCPNQILQKLEEIKSDISNKSESKGWKRQMISYQNLHPKFIKNLLEKHPNLSPHEIEICQMTRLGLDNKEIAELFFITLGSLRVSKSRLRKKLGLPTSQNLRLYLSSI